MIPPSCAIDFDRFEALTFDCYGTLIDWETGILHSLRPLLERRGKKIDDAEILKLYGELEAVNEAGEYRRYREVLESVVKGMAERFGSAATAEEARSLPDSLGQWQPWPDTVNALRSLQARFRLCVISNIDDDLFAATLPKLGARFDHVITAEQARAYKPSLKIFNLAFERISVPASRILHVGQSVYHDIVPARSLGLSTVWVDRPSRRKGVGAVQPAQATPDLRVSSLAELVSVSQA